MRAEFPQSIDINQMLVFSVFGHLVILTIVLFLPKPLHEVKVVVPAFIVSLVETSSGNKLAAQKKTIGDRKTPIKKSKPKTKKPSDVTFTFFLSIKTSEPGSVFPRINEP